MARGSVGTDVSDCGRKDLSKEGRLRETRGRRYTVMFAAAATLAIAACVDGATAPVGTVTPAGLAPAASASDGQVMQSITGNGQTAGLRTFDVSVEGRADGSVTGWVCVRHRGSGGAHVRVAVDCLHVNGNHAWGGGTIAFAVDPENIGNPYAFMVVDNGEGVNAPPDEIVSVQAFLDCRTEWSRGTRQVTIGNLQVRG